MEQVPADKRQRMPSSRVLEEVIDQAPADYFTVGWLTSTLQQRSFGIVMLLLGLLATIPVGSTVPGLMLAALAVQLIAGRSEPVFPHFITTRRLPTRHLLRLGGLTRSAKPTGPTRCSGTVRCKQTRSSRSNPTK